MSYVLFGILLGVSFAFWVKIFKEDKIDDL